MKWNVEIESEKKEKITVQVTADCRGKAELLALDKALEVNDSYWYKVITSYQLP